MRFFIMIALAITIGGCAGQTERLSQINLGMTKPEVAQALGTPYTVRGSIRNKFGQTVEIWEATLSKPKTQRQMVGGAAATVVSFGLLSPLLLMPGDEVRFWLYFVNDRLERWGEAGDWSREADRIYEVRFGGPEKLAR